MKIARKPRRVEVDDHRRHLDPGGLIPADPQRFNALCRLLVESNDGTTLGPTADVVELFSRLGDPLDDVLAEHAEWWRSHRGDE